MVDNFDRSSLDIKIKIAICQAFIDWCKFENRNLLGHSLRVKHVDMLYYSGEFLEALSK
ncbi:MAG: hypothetical protein MHPSP_004289, partial [Paramarteilia canceri]